MAKKKASVGSGGGKYKPFRMIRLPEPLAQSLDKIADKRVSTVTEEVKQAVREYIDRQGERIGDDPPKK